MRHLLIADDDSTLGTTLEKFLGKHLGGIGIARVESVTEARESMLKSEPDVVLTDLRLGDGSGLDILKAAVNLSSKPMVILLTGNATLETAIEALRLGAFDYLQKPYEEEHLLHTVRLAFESKRLRERVRDLSVLTSEDPSRASPVPIQEDPKTKKLFEDASRLALGSAPILLTGESGVGKEILARHVHAKSPRASEAFVAINCAAIPETLLEAELFGYEKGAFTGAASSRKGKFELADGGTLFLDEIGELPISLQPKLLRVLDGHGFLRLGGQATVTADVRIIAATNRRIDDEVSSGRFRQDLFYRLNVGRLDIPPLRNRPADILPLADRILENLRRKYRRSNIRLSSDSQKKFLEYSWPGNVRELQNVLERAVLLSDADSIDVTLELGVAASGEVQRSLEVSSGSSLSDVLDSYERHLIVSAMTKHDNNKTAVAKGLGLSKQLLNYKLRKYEITG